MDGKIHILTQASTLKSGINSGLTSFFFGSDGEGILTVDEFLRFQRHLQTEILKLEFERKCDGASADLSETDFAELLIVYAGFPDKKKARMIKRVKKAFGGGGGDDEGHQAGEGEGRIGLQDYLR